MDSDDEDFIKKKVGFGGLDQKFLHGNENSDLPDDLNAFLRYVEKKFDEEFKMSLEKLSKESKVFEPVIVDVEPVLHALTGVEYLLLQEDIWSMDEETEKEEVTGEPLELKTMKKLKLSEPNPDIVNKQQCYVFLIKQLHLMEMMPNYKSVYVFENHRTELFTIMGMLLKKVEILDEKNKVIRLEVFDFTESIKCIVKYEPKSVLKIGRDRSENKEGSYKRRQRLIAYELAEDPNFDNDDDYEKPPSVKAMNDLFYIPSQKALWKNLVENLFPGDIVAITSKMKERQKDSSRYLYGHSIQKSNFSDFSLFLYMLKASHMDKPNRNN